MVGNPVVTGWPQPLHCTGARRRARQLQGYGIHADVRVNQHMQTVFRDTLRGMGEIATKGMEMIQMCGDALGLGVAFGAHMIAEKFKTVAVMAFEPAPQENSDRVRAHQGGDISDADTPAGRQRRHLWVLAEAGKVGRHDPTNETAVKDLQFAIVFALILQEEVGRAGDPGQGAPPFLRRIESAFLWSGG
jgi:hypothetical protein